PVLPAVRRPWRPWPLRRPGDQVELGTRLGHAPLEPVGIGGARPPRGDHARRWTSLLTRQSNTSFPRKRESRGSRWIPAFAGMTTLLFGCRLNRMGTTVDASPLHAGWWGSPNARPGNPRRRASAPEPCRRPPAEPPGSGRESRTGCRGAVARRAPGPAADARCADRPAAR